MKYFVHGHSGHIQDASAVMPAATNYYGWGLDFVLSKLGTWVHFAVPSLGGGTHGVQHIQLDFKTGGDCWVAEVHVYDGEVLFRTLQGHWTGSTVLDLGAVWTIHRGLGVSLHCVRGVESAAHSFRFLAVGADFVEV